MVDKNVQNNLTLVSPQAIMANSSETVNPRPKDLAGKTVVLYWNGKPNGDSFLTRIGELLEQRAAGIKVIKAWETLPGSHQTPPDPEASRAVAQKVAALKPDLVIGAPGDCAGSATWLIIDLLNLERRGIPTVTVLTEPFLEVARSVALSEGFGDAGFVAVPAPLGMLSASAIRQKAEKAFEAVFSAATTWQPILATAQKQVPYPADIIEVPAGVEEISRLFRRQKWSLGLPIIPPLPNLVAKMLQGTRRKADEILGRVPPEMGLLTVELTAVYAVMAGCRPKYLPLLIAAIEALLAPEANWRLALTGTGTSQVVVVVNGPVVSAIGLGCGQGAAGKGQHANGTIGYALNLLAYGVGGSVPPTLDRSTLGSPADFVCWVFGENQDALPTGWQPLHVFRGFAPDQSVVTVMAGYPPIENMDHWSATAKEHMRWWGHIVSPLHNMGGPCVFQVMRQNPIIAIGPEHARLMAAQGMSQSDFRSAFWEQTRIPLSVWPAACTLEDNPETAAFLEAGKRIPVTLSPEQLLTVMAGGDGKQSHYFAPLPGAFPVSKLVTI